MAEEKQPIIIKRVYKKEGHHGGSWKVAFADFATALMAFFLLMWIIGAATEAQQQGIAEYFQNPAGVQGPGGASVSAIDLGGSMDGHAAPVLDANVPPANLLPGESGSRDSSKIDNDGTGGGIQSTPVTDGSEQIRLNDLKQVLEEAIARSRALEPYKDHLLLDITPQGLRIQIIDREFESMFSVGSASLELHTQRILAEIAAIINTVPNKVSITGHTDARAYQRVAYSNWELSADRANAARRALVDGGMAAEKVAQIVGLGSSVPFDKADPLSPINRRISIVVLNAEAEEAMIEDAPTVQISEFTAREEL